jgi:hypothetical protein
VPAEVEIGHGLEAGDNEAQKKRGLSGQTQCERPEGSPPSEKKKMKMRMMMMKTNNKLPLIPLL